MSRSPAHEGKLIEYLRQHPDVAAALLCHDTSRRRKGTRRLAYILSPIVAAGILFFALTPPGRALANHAYHQVLKYADGVLYIQPRNAANEVGPTSNAFAFHQVEPANFTDIQQASAYIQCPLLYVDAADVTIESIQIDSNPAVNNILTIYLIDGNPAFHIQQTIMKEGSSWGTTIDFNDSPPVQKTLINGETMLCSYTDEGYALGFSEWENVQLFMDSTTLKWDELTTYLDHLAYAGPN